MQLSSSIKEVYWPEKTVHYVFREGFFVSTGLMNYRIYVILKLEDNLKMTAVSITSIEHCNCT